MRRRRWRWCLGCSRRRGRRRRLPLRRCRGGRRRGRSSGLWRRGRGGRRGRRGTRSGRRSLRRGLLALVFLRLCRRLRDGDRRGLRLRRHACELHRREGGRGKQHEAKVCHDGLVSPEGSLHREFGTGDQQPALGRIVATAKRRQLFILASQRLRHSLVHDPFSPCFQSESSMLSPAACLKDVRRGYRWRDLACAVRPGRVVEPLPESARAAHRVAAARPARAPATGFPDLDCPAESPAAARRACLELPAEFLAARSA
jgi:hypothetical protein